MQLEYRPEASLVQRLDGKPCWTDQRIDLLKDLWADGLSARQIASRLGGVSRSAVIGKVHRLGLAGRATISRAARRPSTLALFPAGFPEYKPHKRKAVRFPSREKPSIAPVRSLPELGAAPEGLTTLTGLTQRMCHWPMGDPKEDGFHFCGRHKTSGIPYCEHHAAVAYRPAAGKSAAR